MTSTLKGILAAAFFAALGIVGYYVVEYYGWRATRWTMKRG